MDLAMTDLQQVILNQNAPFYESGSENYGMRDEYCKVILFILITYYIAKKIY